MKFTGFFMKHVYLAESLIITFIILEIILTINKNLARNYLTTPSKLSIAMLKTFA